MQDHDGIKKTIGTLFTLLFSIALLISVGCYIFRDNLLQLVNTPQEAYAYTMDYTVICILGLIFIYGYNVVSAIMRGMGDSKRPFMFVAILYLLQDLRWKLLELPGQQL